MSTVSMRCTLSIERMVWIMSVTISCALPTGQHRNSLSPDTAMIRLICDALRGRCSCSILGLRMKWLGDGDHGRAVSSPSLQGAIEYSLVSVCIQAVLPDGPGRPETNVTDNLTTGSGTWSMPCHGLARMPPTRGPMRLRARRAAWQNSTEPTRGRRRASRCWAS